MKYRNAFAALTLAAILALTGACGNDGPPDDPQGDADTSTSPDTSTPASTSPDTSTDTSTPDSTGPDSTGPATSDAEDADPSSTPPAGSPSPSGSLSEASADELLVGLSEAEAEDAAEEQGWIIRVARRDGEDLPMTMDFRENRVNVEITADEVTAIVSLG